LPLPPDSNPASVYKRVFAELGTDQTAIQKLRAERKSVLDAVMDGYGTLAPKLGASDKARMESHLAEIRDLETRLTANVGVGTACVKPVAPTIDYKANDNFPAIGRAQTDLLVMALACDLTRVATIQGERSVGDVRFTWLGATRGHHAISHDPDTTLDSVEMLTDQHLVRRAIRIPPRQVLAASRRDGDDARQYPRLLVQRALARQHTLTGYALRAGRRTGAQDDGRPRLSEDSERRTTTCSCRS
jgi:hypothetical protein